MTDSDRQQTLIQSFAARVAQDHDRDALFCWGEGQFRATTWGELARRVRRTAATLRKLNVQPGDRVVQISENRRSWIEVDLAIQMLRAVHVPIHAPLTGAQIMQQIDDCGTKLAIVSTPEQAEKLSSNLVGGDFQRTVRFLSVDPCEQKISGDEIQLLDELIGQLPEDDYPHIEQEAIERGASDGCATILYTSGTTGEPKGVVLTHRNLVTNAIGTTERFDFGRDDVRLNFLPLSHVFARTCCLYTTIIGGSKLALAQSRDTVLDDCKVIQPTVLNGVPYFFDKLHRILIDENRADEPGALRELLGGRIKYCCSGGAALPDHLDMYFQSQGIPLLQGYGLTETSPVITISSPSAHKVGYVGQVIRNVEVKIADDGEILSRGPHIMVGYWNRPTATDEVLKDGWFYTGDLGSLDEDGFLKITGRKKEILVTAGGKNIAPVLLESLLTADPLIHQALIIGDGKKYLSALIVPELAAIREALPNQEDDRESLESPEVQALLRERISQRLTDVSYYEQVQKFALLERPFTLEQGELTPTLKLRRGVICEHFADQIESLYS